MRKVANPVEEITPEIRELAGNMIDTMRVNDGIGLAAPQVNILKRMFVIDLELIEEELAPQAYLNPEILEIEGQEKMEEGCLSIPDVRGDVVRPFQIRVRYQDLDGQTREEVMDDLLARVFQHELDHLNGVLFIDKLPVIQRKLLEPRLKQIREAFSLL